MTLTFISKYFQFFAFKDRLLSLTTRRWATNLGGGSTTNGRDSSGKRLGVKLGNGKF
jgi:hypothetical protein